MSELMVNGEHVTEEWVSERMKRHGLPEYMAGGVYRYLAHRIAGGSFLNAVLSNDLTEAFAQADDQNARCMHGWVRFMYCELPIGSWGSHESVKNWLAQRKVA